MNPPHPSPASPASDAEFYRQLQQVTARIHDTGSLTQLMVDLSQDICTLLNADRLTLYVVGEEGKTIVSRVKTGLNTSRELKLPISAQSLSGFVAMTRQTLNIADVYSDDELHRIDPRLTYFKEVDRRSGYRTRQMMVAPIQAGNELQGVLQVINHLAGERFSALQQEGVERLCQTLSTAIRQRSESAPVARPALASKYDSLVTDGVLTAEELHQCIHQARATGQTVEQQLQAAYQVGTPQLGAALAHFFRAPFVGFDAGRIRSEPLHGRLKREFVLSRQWLPLENTAEGLLVMCLDPEAVRSARLVPQVFPQHNRFVYAVTTQAAFEQTLDQLYPSATDHSTIDDLLADLQTPAEDEVASELSVASAAADNELVKFVNKVILDAHHQGASDIHIEPLPGKAKTGIRFRIDGALQPYIEVPAAYRDAMVARLKIMCDLDISEKRKPQDGKIKFQKFGPLDIELRVATLPSAGGVEDVVMRILAAGEPLPLDKLGLTEHNRARLLSTIGQPYGLFYVCGPTGSGKTTTLHSILKHLNTPDTKIWTAEDPVEITQKGLRQVQVNKKAGIDFALVMRAFLRADPDIIMVGESRDAETVGMGVEASLTGHLVFSTLHTNSAPESITRLLDMGMDPFNFADALLGILAQRLARRLCACKEAYVPTPDELQLFVAEYTQTLMTTQRWQADPEGQQAELLRTWHTQYATHGQLHLHRAVGCEACRHTGYKGRVGLHELLLASEHVRELIQTRARVATLLQACVEDGMHTLKMDGMEKVLMGLTDLKQVRAVCIK